MSDYTLIPAAEFKKIANDDAVTLDVRTPAEHQSQHLLRPHDHMPLDQLSPKEFMQKRGLGKDAHVYLLCRGGTRAKAAAEKFAAEGFKNVHVIDGGIIACESCGEPVSSPSGGAKVMSIERQVRIVAGALVVLGALLGYFSHSIYHLLSLAVGGGLVYAGITDRCSLSMVLCKAPWNKGASCNIKT